MAFLNITRWLGPPWALPSSTFLPIRSDKRRTEGVMSLRAGVSSLCFLVVLGSGRPSYSVPPQDAEAAYESQIRPLLAKYCFGGHGKEQPKAKLDLASFRSVNSVLQSRKAWKKVWDQLQA